MHHKRMILGAILGALILFGTLPGVACAIPRDRVLARGKVWVNRHVAYSQSRFASVEGTLVANGTKAERAIAPTLGYRTDCSGFVSLCFGLVNSEGKPLSYTTRTLSPSIVTTITKAEISPGDVLLLKGSHVVLFVGWTDSTKSSFKAYEEKGTAYGTVATTRDYSQMKSWGYHAYRYKKISESYSDVEHAIYGTTRYRTAAKAAHLRFPGKSTAPALVITNGDDWTGNVTASALASACGGPLLLTAKDCLPASTTAEIKRLKPSRIYLLGGASLIATDVASEIASLTPHVTRLVGPSRYELAGKVGSVAAGLLRAKGTTVDTAYLIGSDAFSDGVAVSSVSAATGRPVFIAGATKLGRPTLAGLKAVGIKKVIIVGSTAVIGENVVSRLTENHISVTRIAGTSRYATALKVAQHGVALNRGLGWSRVGVASGENLHGMLACGIAQGETGSVMLLTARDALPTGTKAQITAQAANTGKVRVFGSYGQVEQSPRASIAKVLRAAQ